MTTATIDLGRRAEARSVAPAREASPFRSALLARPETLVVALLAATGYIVAGWIFRYHFGYAVGDSLARSAKAVFMGASRDPHFGAVGFYWPPLPSTLQIPLVLVLRPFGRMDFAGPVSTALLSAGSVLVVGQICRELNHGRLTSLLCCLLFAANPVIFVYSINGMSEACAYLCILLILMAWLRWVRRRVVIDLALMGLAAAALVMTRIETLPMVFGLGLVAGAGRDVRQWVARAVTVSLPAVVAMALWMGTQFILLGDPLAFLHYGNAGGPKTFTPPFRHEYDLPGHGGYLATVPWVLAWVLVLAPGVLVLAAFGLARPRRHLYVAAGLGCVASVFPLVQMYLIDHQVGFGDPRYFTGMIPVGMVAVIYLSAALGGGVAAPPPVFRRLVLPAIDADTDVNLRQHRTGRAPSARKVGAGLVAASLVGTGAVSLAYMLSPNRTRIGQEHFVFQILLGQRVQREDTIGASQALARYLDPYLARGQLAIVDTNYAFAVDLFSRHPAGFIIPEDRDFLTTLENPGGKFQWIIAPSNASVTNGVPDQISPLVSPRSDWENRGAYGGLVLWHYVGPPVAPPSAPPSAGAS